MPRDPHRRIVLANLGFREEPFSRSADERFLYLSEAHGNVYRGVREVVENRRALGVVMGRYGLGKSTIARRIDNVYNNEEMNTDEEGYEVVYLPTAAFDTEYDILMAVSRFLRLERRKGKNAQWDEFEQHLVDMAEKNRNVVIIMDDAQLMKPDALVFLHRTYNFDQSQKLVQVLMFGQPEISELFVKYPGVRSRVDEWFHLNPLPIEETLGLVTFRCRTAGRDDPFLTPDALDKLHAASQGIPRTIVAILSKVVDILGTTRPRKTVADTEIMDQAIQAYLENMPQG